MSKNFFQHIADAESYSTPIWLATVITVEGSTPVEVGMKMIIYPDGTIEGTIGGGEIERRVIESVIQKKPTDSVKWRYDLGINHQDAEKTGMACGGYQEIFVEPLFGGTPLTIIGGGHCGVALSALAAKTGFFVTIIDDRPEWASKEKHPHAAICLCAPFEDIAEKIEFSPNAYIVIMTHGHKHDEMVLRQCLGKECRYLGMLGSETKVRTLLERLTKDGITRSTLQNVYTPIGFDIGSHTPDEIAVSILAQMLAVKYGRSAIQFNSNPFLK